MTPSQFSISFSGHHQNICAGLSSLQQRSEFVDMTLAADGHLVKVHQFLMALASPYLNELIKSADCKHPVIFLNKISYETLCGIVEYIYTGEVNVSSDKVTDLLEAAKSLHIMGLDHMDVTDNEMTGPLNVQCNNLQAELLLHVSNQSDDENYQNTNYADDDHMSIHSDGYNGPENIPIQGSIPKQKYIPQGVKKDESITKVQYTVSNRGSLQLICNRYMYYPIYFYKEKNLRKWRCVNTIDKKCRAFVVTHGDAVVQRTKAHNHPFHDKRILRKTQLGAVFSGVHDAEKSIHVKLEKKVMANLEKERKD